MSPALRTWGRRAAVSLFALVGVAAVAVVIGVVRGERLRTRTVEVPARPFALLAEPSPAQLERGRHLYLSRGCTDCHGADGAGRAFLDDPGGLQVHGPQIAPGRHNVTANYRPEDWSRAIRHGVAPSGRPLMVMPSEDFAGLADEDLAALVAHLQRLPAVEGRLGLVKLPLPARALYGFGVLRDAASKIDHARGPSQPVAPGVTVEYGRYVAMSCIGCHGAALEGGRIPGAPPDWPPAPRLAAGEGSVMPRYADAAHLQALFRSGRRDDGTPVKVMPFEALAHLDETEVAALHLYLRTR